MHKEKFEYYLAPEVLKKPLILLDDVGMMGPDYGFYLYSNGDIWYVLAEADFSLASSVVPEIDHLFPVTVRGWCTPRAQKRGLLPSDFFSDNDKQSSATPESYEEITIEKDGLRHAFLQVEPNEGVGINDFLT